MQKYVYLFTEFCVGLLFYFTDTGRSQFTDFSISKCSFVRLEAQTICKAPYPYIRPISLVRVE